MQRVLVTGASRGIGAATARLLTDAGYEVIGTSRHPERIADPPAGVRFLALDVTDPQSVSTLIGEVGRVDILINNAGSSQFGPLEEIPLSRVDHFIRLYLNGPIQLIQGFLPGMRESCSGTIINITSMAGKVGVPFTSIYCAGKHGLEGFSKALRQEVRHCGVKVVTLAPVYVRTSIPMESHLLEDSPYREPALHFRKTRDALIAAGIEPEAVARLILHILRKNHPAPNYSVGHNARIMGFFLRLLPQRIAEHMEYVRLLGSSRKS
jgi:short-subunit dehydrogenase